MRFAFRPKPSQLPFIREMAKATLYASLVGLFADLAAVFYKAPDIAERKHVELNLILVQGFGESASPAILGFTAQKGIEAVLHRGHTRTQTPAGARSFARLPQPPRR